MSLIIKYTKAQYQAKITELESYSQQLEQHLSRMEGLKEKMFQFWDDPNARTVGQVLNIQIRQVRNATTRTNDLLTFYRTSVEKLDASGGLASGLLEEAMGILTGLGI